MPRRLFLLSPGVLGDDLTTRVDVEDGMEHCVWPFELYGACVVAEEVFEGGVAAATELEVVLLG